MITAPQLEAAPDRYIIGDDDGDLKGNARIANAVIQFDNSNVDASQIQATSHACKVYYCVIRAQAGRSTTNIEAPPQSH